MMHAERARRRDCRACLVVACFCFLRQPILLDFADPSRRVVPVALSFVMNRVGGLIARRARGCKRTHVQFMDFVLFCFGQRSLRDCSLVANWGRAMQHRSPAVQGNFPSASEILATFCSVVLWSAAAGGPPNVLGEK